jgi:hypothetical protein
MSGETDLDQILTVIKNTKNTSSVDWTSYNLTLSGRSILDSRYSSSIEYLVSSIEPQFDINISTTGLFDFTLTQSPVREPVSIFPFDIDGLGLLCRRRVPARGGLT